jgi:hypothetical protein
VILFPWCESDFKASISHYMSIIITLKICLWFLNSEMLFPTTQI